MYRKPKGRDCCRLVYVCTTCCLIKHLDESSPFRAVLALHFACFAGGLRLQGSDSFVPLLLNLRKVPGEILPIHTYMRRTSRWRPKEVSFGLRSSVHLSTRRGAVLG